MVEAKCGYCFSTDVEIVDSLERREAMEIRCRRCQRVTPVDVENPNADIMDQEQDANREPG